MIGGFHRFNSAKESCSYLGLIPIICQSGNSVRRKSKISKIGNARLRNLLFMCSFNTCKYNKACKAIYVRIIAKVKNWH